MTKAAKSGRPEELIVVTIYALAWWMVMPCMSERKAPVFYHIGLAAAVLIPQHQDIAYVATAS
jgi:hypothetical protein